MRSESPDRSLRNRFAGLTLDRREEWRADPQRLREAWATGCVAIVDFEGQALAQGEALARVPAGTLAAELFETASFLGEHEAQPWFALPASALSEPPLADATWVGLRDAAARWDAFDCGMFAYAKALLLWQTRARHCGACGTATALTRAGHCARCTNPDCGLEQFPRTDAAIIVVVADGTRCLLGRQPGWPPGRYSTLAGFVEPGESLEDAVRREVREEAGVRVGAVSYHSSQPWPFPGALMVGFHAQAADTAIQIGDELEDARWFEAQALVDAVRRGETQLPPSISISRRLVEDWLEGVLGADAVAELRARPGR